MNEYFWKLLYIYIYISGRWFWFGNRGKRECPLPRNSSEWVQYYERPLTLREQRPTTTSMLLYSKARRCNGAGKLEASKVLAAAANGTSPADEGEILSSFRGKTVDFPRTRNYFLALALTPVPYPLKNRYLIFEIFQYSRYRREGRYIENALSTPLIRSKWKFYNTW